MRKFLFKVIVFSAILVLYFAANMAVNRYIFLHEPLPLKDKLVLIAGDSHTQKSLNPKYFPSAQNISQVAEPYVVTYWKLKRIFKSTKPDILILGFAPHNFSEFNDIKFSNEKWSGEMFKRYYPIEEFDEISNKVSVDLNKFYEVLWKQTAFYPKPSHINYLGKYTNNHKSNINNWRITIRRHYYHDRQAFAVSKFSTGYLDSIVALCKAKNIQLVLASNPVYGKYHKKIPSKFKKAFNRVIRKNKNHCLIFDKTKEVYPDSLFLNSDHLNEYGAKRFSEELIEYLGKRSPKNSLVSRP